MSSDSGLRLEVEGSTGDRSSERASERSSVRSSDDGFRPVTGALYGAVSFVVVYLATSLLYLYDVWSEGESVVDFLEAGQLVDFFGMVFYNAHRIDVVLSVQGMSASQPFSYVQGLGQPIEILFYLLPVAILFDAGHRLVSKAEESLSGSAAAVAGGSVVVGYLPLFVAGSLFFTLQELDGPVSPELDAWLLLVGAGYAAVAGALGGVFASWSGR